jgi:Fe-S cluster biogenesis protein NfuA
MPSMASVMARTIFISSESTPNPDSLKFCPADVVILQEEQGTGVVSLDQFSPCIWCPFRGCGDIPAIDLMCLDRLRSQFFDTLTKARGSKLVSDLLRMPGVTGVFLGRDFITVNKIEQAAWDDLKPVVLSRMMDELASDKPVLSGEFHMELETADDDDDDEVVSMIKELIDTRIRPAVQEDGGDIFYVSFDHETGIVELKMAGSCVGCPSSTATLRGGVENMLKHYVPEVSSISQVVEDGEGGHKPLEEADGAAHTLEEKLATAGVQGY